MLRRVVMGFGVLAWLSVGSSIQAQVTAPPSQAPLQSLAGRYEGNAATEYGPTVVTANIRVSNGVITGSMTSTYGPLKITGGSLTGEALLLTLDMNGNGGSVSALYSGGKIAGQWTVGSDSGNFTMAKVAEPGAASATDPAGPAHTAAGVSPAASGGDPLTGDWNAAVDAGGNQTAFTISMKLDGEKVAGQIGTERGSVPFEGSWTNGTLSLSVSMPNGAITMTATLSEGRLVGTLTAGGGQFTGGWAAERRK